MYYSWLAVLGQDGVGVLDRIMHDHRHLFTSVEASHAFREILKYDLAKLANERHQEYVNLEKRTNVDTVAVAHKVQDAGFVMNDEEMALLESGRTVDAIKAVRGRFAEEGYKSLGLKEAKLYVDAIRLGLFNKG